MEVNNTMVYIDNLLQGNSDKECADILREVISECQERIEYYENGAYANQLK